MRKPVEQAITDAKLTPDKIEKIIMIGGPTRMPTVQKFVEEYVGKQIERGVDPMEAVAKGAAIQAGVMSGDVQGKEILLLDVTPLTLGLETLGGVRTAIIDRNTTVPTSKSQVFSTAADNQTSVEIHILQGEREFANDNKSLGRFILDGIAPAPRGMPQIEVTFDIDTNGILSVKAKDKGTGKEQHITIQGSTGLSKDEVERMRKDAEVNAEADKKKRDLVDARNGADALIFNLEKQMREYDAKISDDVKKKVNVKMNDLREVLKKDGATAEEIKKSTEALATDAQEIGKTVYEEAQKKANAESGDKKKDENVKDAEVVDDKDKKKKK
jgi:molecular chaperone DnaK